MCRWQNVNSDLIAKQIQRLHKVCSLNCVNVELIWRSACSSVLTASQDEMFGRKFRTVGSWDCRSEAESKQMRTTDQIRGSANTLAAIVVMLVGLFFAAALCCGGPAEFLASLHSESFRTHSEPTNTLEALRGLEVRK